MSSIGILFVVCFACGVCSSTSNSASDESNLIPDYYWRDYNGIIPNDAIPGGISKAGTKTYIGQVYKLYKGAGLLPATIYPDSKSALYGDYGLSLESKDFVKILCSQNHDRYKWILTKNDETHLLTDCHLVVGGTELEYVVHIARVNHEMQTIIGKVFAHHTPYRGLHIPYKDKQISFMSYEILTYNCNVNHYYAFLNITSVDV